MSSITEFRSIFGKRGQAKNNRFRVSIATAGLDQSIVQDTNFVRDLMFKCTDAELVGRSLQTEDHRIYGIPVKKAYQSAFTDINLSFYTSESMEEFIFFQNWVRFVNGYDTYDFNFPDQYRASILIEKLSEVNNEVVMTMKLNKAYPVNVAGVPLSWSDEGLIRTVVQFVFESYEIENESESEEVATAKDKAKTGTKQTANPNLSLNSKLKGGTKTKVG